MTGFSKKEVDNASNAGYHLAMLRRKPIRRTSRKKRAQVEGYRKVLFDVYFAPLDDKFLPDGETEPDWVAKCQLCGLPVNFRAAEAHHKVKQSACGDDSPENMVCMHHDCHVKFVHDHARFGHEIEQEVAASTANLLNRQRIQLSPTSTYNLRRELARHLMRAVGSLRR